MQIANSIPILIYGPQKGVSNLSILLVQIERLLHYSPRYYYTLNIFSLLLYFQCLFKPSQILQFQRHMSTSIHSCNVMATSCKYIILVQIHSLSCYASHCVNIWHGVAHLEKWSRNAHGLKEKLLKC